MKYEHRAIIDAASREGKLPSELAQELLGHDLLKSMVNAISKPAVPFSKMSEQQQESVIEDLKKDLLPAISNAIGIIVSQNSHAVRMKLKKLETGTSFKLTGTIEKTQDHIHELMDLATDNSDVLVILHERDYVQGLDAVKGEKDQKPLDLDSSESAKPAKKAGPGKKTDKAAIELPEKLIADAKEYVKRNNVAAIAALQNGLHIGYEKGEALLARLQADGDVSAPDAEGNRTVVKGAANPVFDKATLEVMYSTACREVIKAGSADDSVLRPIYGDDDNLIECALMGMEEDGIVSKPSPEGLRAVLTLP